MVTKKLAMLLLAAMIIVLGFAPHEVQAAPGLGPEIVPVSPANNTTIATSTPTILANFSSPAGFDNVIISITVDGKDQTLNATQTVITNHNVTYIVSPQYPLSNGQHNVTVNVTDDAGVSAGLNWTFFVNTQGSSITAQQVLLGVSLVVGLGLAAFAIVLVYLKRTRNFSLRKHLKKFPIPKRVWYVGLPAVAAFFFVLIALSYFEGSPGVTPFITEYVLVIGIFILLLPYSIYVQTEKKKKAEYERSFSQFLYEMADAMRGGIDPSKAVIEMAKNDSSILKKHLKIAANGLEMGRPFEEMIEAMVKPIDSKLVKRYASLIGESAKVGGEISQVVHRAAKDMDDLIKIEQDRSRSLSIQGTTIYISFGVLVVVIYLLINIYPSLGQADLGNLFAGSGGSLPASGSASSSSTTAAPMSYITLKQRFLDLTIITGLGSGLIIGLFTNGKVKFGLVHGLGMMLAGMVFLIIMMG